MCKTMNKNWQQHITKKLGNRKYLVLKHSRSNKSEGMVPILFIIFYWWWILLLMHACMQQQDHVSVWPSNDSWEKIIQMLQECLILRLKAYRIEKCWHFSASFFSSALIRSIDMESILTSGLLGLDVRMESPLWWLASAKTHSSMVKESANYTACRHKASYVHKLIQKWVIEWLKWSDEDSDVMNSLCTQHKHTPNISEIHHKIVVEDPNRQVRFYSHTMKSSVKNTSVVLKIIMK